LGGRSDLSFTKETTRDSTTLGNTRPGKPFPDYPLFAHHNGQWAKKIRGKFHYFGPWNDPGGALVRYEKEKDDLQAGREPQPDEPSDALTVHQMVYLFLEAKKLMVQSRELEERTWLDYKRYGDRMIRVFGTKTKVESPGPADFKRLREDIQKTYKSLFSIKSAIRKTKVFFNWAGPGVHGQGYFDKMPRFGDAFRAPSASALERESRGEQVFTAAQIRAVLAAANPRLKAMILLGINCGYGNTDCIKLDMRRLDLDEGWATLPRTKNGNKRRCPLWPETVEALRAVPKQRKTPEDRAYARRIFITQFGEPYRPRNLSRELGNAMERAGMGREERFKTVSERCSAA
jgi:integrase